MVRSNEKQAQRPNTERGIKIMIIDLIRGHIKTCPLLNGERVNVDFIGADMHYSINPVNCSPILKKYTDGGSQRQYQFEFTSKEYYDEDSAVNIENSGFYELFEEWLENNPLPSLEGNKTPISYETLSKGFLYDVDGANARYRIDCRLIYEQER